MKRIFSSVVCVRDTNLHDHTTVDSVAGIVKITSHTNTCVYTYITLLHIMY